MLSKNDRRRAGDPDAREGELSHRRWEATDLHRARLYPALRGWFCLFDAVPGLRIFHRSDYEQRVGESSLTFFDLILHWRVQPNARFQSREPAWK